MSIDKIQEDPRLQKLFSNTFKHAILGDKAQWVSLEWLLEIANPAPNEQVKLLDQSIISSEDLWKDIEKKGMRDPFIIACGSIDGRVRLETGNHRIQLLLSKGILHAPAVALLTEIAWVDKDNGSHEGKQLKLWATQPVAPLGVYAERLYMKPSLLIPSCPAFDQKGFLEDKAPIKKDIKKPVSKTKEKEVVRTRKSKAKPDEANPSSPHPADAELDVLDSLITETKPEVTSAAPTPAKAVSAEDAFLSDDFNFDN